MPRQTKGSKVMDYIFEIVGFVFTILGITCIFTGYLVGYLLRNTKPEDTDL